MPDGSILNPVSSLCEPGGGKLLVEPASITGKKPNPSASAKFRDEGKFLRNAGKLSEAELAFSRALEHDPDDALAHIMLGLLAIERNMPVEVVRNFRRAIALDPGNVGAYVELSRWYRSIVAYEKAERILVDAIEENPHSVEAYDELARWYHGVGRYREAESVFKSAASLSRVYEAHYYKTGWLGLPGEKRNTTCDSLSVIVEHDPGNIEALLALSNMHYHHFEQFDKIEGLLLRGLKAKPANIEAHLHIAGWYREVGRYSDAERVLKNAAAIDPADERPYLIRATCAEIQKHHEETERAYKRAIELAPGNLDACCDLARFYRDRNSMDLCKETLLQGFARNPGSSQAAHHLGCWYKNALSLKNRWKDNGDEEREKAEYYFRRALELDASNPCPYIELAYLQKEAGDYSQVESLFKKALEVDPGYCDAYFELSRWLWSQGEYRRSYRMFDTALEMNPKNNYFEPARNIGFNSFNPVTRENFQTCKEIVSSRGKVLILVQYPTIPVSILERLLGDDREGIIFVDNENTFREAVAAESYNAYFRDSYGTSFGHCTARGNRLLAARIADAILSGSFGDSLEYPITRLVSGGL